MSLYEHVLIARPDISTQQVEAMVETFSTIIKDGGGTIGKSEYWGLRTFTYKVKKNRKGHYQLLNIDAPHAAVAEMERQMGLHEDVLRFMTIRVDEHETEPSAMMQKQGGRDDRRGGGGFRSERSDRGERGDRGDRPPRPARDSADDFSGFNTEDSE